jgi:hypothetical protein
LKKCERGFTEVVGDKTLGQDETKECIMEMMVG